MMAEVSFHATGLMPIPCFCEICSKAKYWIGNCVIKSKDDILAALEALKGRPLYAEKWAKFRMVSRRVTTLMTNPGVLMRTRNLR